MLSVQKQMPYADFKSVQQLDFDVLENSTCTRVTVESRDSKNIFCVQLFAHNRFKYSEKSIFLNPKTILSKQL